jgi:hypothetical protein
MMSLILPPPPLTDDAVFGLTETVFLLHVVAVFNNKTGNVQCVRKVAVHLQKVLEMMSTRGYTGLNPFNFIRKHFVQICVRKVAVHL